MSLWRQLQKMFDKLQAAQPTGDVRLSNGNIISYIHVGVGTAPYFQIDHASGTTYIYESTANGISAELVQQILADNADN